MFVWLKLLYRQFIGEVLDFCVENFLTVNSQTHFYKNIVKFSRYGYAPVSLEYFPDISGSFVNRGCK